MMKVGLLKLKLLLDGKGELTCHQKAFQLTILYCQGKASNDKLS